MAKRGQTKPYKVRYQYPHMDKPATHAYSSRLDADSAAVEVAMYGAKHKMVVEVLLKNDQGDLIPAGKFGPGIEHRIIWDHNERDWTCTCGAWGTRQPYETNGYHSHESAAKTLQGDDE